MLHYIKGQLTMKLDGAVAVETGGVGYRIFVPDNSEFYRTKEGDPVIVYTEMIVREDDISVYGFAESESLELFKKLITVSGVGAKAALAVLSAMPIEEVQKAIIFEDTDTLTRANGVGKKTAQRIVLELKDKLDVPSLSDESLPGADTAAGREDLGDSKSEAINGLIALGYSKSEAVSAMLEIKEKDLSTGEYIKLALKRLF